MLRMLFPNHSAPSRRLPKTLGAPKRLELMRLLRIVVFAPVLIALWLYLGDLWAPHGCLDFGGSFDYNNWECNYEVSQTYMDVPFYKIKTFWLVPMSILVAVSILTYIKKFSNGT